MHGEDHYVAMDAYGDVRVPDFVHFRSWIGHRKDDWRNQAIALKTLSECYGDFSPVKWVWDARCSKLLSVDQFFAEIRSSSH